jgi:hypothetical protein
MNAVEIHMRLAMCLTEVGIEPKIISVVAPEGGGRSWICFHSDVDPDMARRAAEIVSPGAEVSFSSTYATIG